MAGLPQACRVPDVAGGLGGPAPGRPPPHPATGRLARFLVDAVAASAVPTGTLRQAGAFEVEQRARRWRAFGGLVLGSVEIALGAIVLYPGSASLRLVNAAVDAMELIGETLLLGGFKSPPIPPAALNRRAHCRAGGSGARRAQVPTRQIAQYGAAPDRPTKRPEPRRSAGRRAAARSRIDHTK